MMGEDEVVDLVGDFRMVAVVMNPVYSELGASCSQLDTTQHFEAYKCIGYVVKEDVSFPFIRGGDHLIKPAKTTREALDISLVQLHPECGSSLVSRLLISIGLFFQGQAQNG